MKNDFAARRRVISKSGHFSFFTFHLSFCIGLESGAAGVGRCAGALALFIGVTAGQKSCNPAPVFPDEGSRGRFSLASRKSKRTAIHETIPPPPPVQVLQNRS
jgi:hypothetical protein